MNVALFEDTHYRDLLPLTWLRTAAELRCGPDRLLDKLRTAFGPLHACHLRSEVHEAVSQRLDLQPPDDGKSWLLVNSGALLPCPCEAPPIGHAWVLNSRVVLAHLTPEQYASLGDAPFESDWHRGLTSAPAPQAIRLMHYPWDLVHANASELTRLCTHGGRHEGHVDAGVHMLAGDNICIEPGARIKPGVVIDAENGPVHIAAGALIEPLSSITGPCYIGENSIIRPGSKIREETTIGPVCRVGGEIEGSLFQGYGNKQHDGFLGHSFVAEWVNLGANTVTSDLKNTYGTIRCDLNGVSIETGQKFIGTTFGDHAKTGIGTILPTGCIVGVAANVFTQDSVPKFVPSYAWLTARGLERYRLYKATQIAQVVMGRRGQQLDSCTEQLLGYVWEEAYKLEAAGWK